MSVKLSHLVYRQFLPSMGPLNMKMIKNTTDKNEVDRIFFTPMAFFNDLPVEGLIKTVAKFWRRVKYVSARALRN